MDFQITTFNLRYDVPSDKENAWPYRVTSVSNFIKQTNPLIVGTQEVKDHMREDLLKNLPNYSAVGMTRLLNSEATPIFYNHDVLEVKETGTFWLSKTPNIPDTRDYDSFCYRVCTYGEFVLKNNRKKRFRVFNTHLDHVSAEAQIEGIKIVYDKIKQKSQQEALPTMVMGDFNVKPYNDVIHFIKDEMKGESGVPYVDAYDYLPEDQMGGTFHDFTGRLGGQPIDYIFSTPDVKIIETNIFKEKVENRFPSDHYPVSIKIELSE